jgi:hypothetical protein
VFDTIYFSINKTFDLMRKANFKTLLAGLMVAFAFLLAGVQSGYAQSSLSTKATGVYAPLGKYTFVSSTEAEAVLTSQTDALAAFVQTLTPGTPAYNQTQRAIMYYRTILTGVVTGKNVDQAIFDGIRMFSTPPFAGASQTEKMNLRNEAINMLKTTPAPNNNTF